MAELSKDQLLGAYDRMSKIRAFEDRLHKENATSNIPGFSHLYAGQEAIATGICEHLSVNDKIASTHRGHGHCIAKGSDIRSMMLEIFGRKDGTNGGKGGAMNVADFSVGMLGANGILGGGPPTTIGAGLTAQYRNEGHVAVSFTGEGGANQGTTFEAMNMAVALQLPVIFVLENDSPVENNSLEFEVGVETISARIKSYGMPLHTVDGSDFFAMHEASEEAVKRARSGAGPSAIEASAIRFYGPFEGDPALARTAKEMEQEKTHHDPLTIFRAKVPDTVSNHELDEIEATNQALVDQAIDDARTAQAPAPSEVTTDVYVSY